jgi:hypothetical protein
MRINISLDDSLLSKVDQYCGENNYNRSELIAEVLRHRIMGVDIKNISTVPKENKTSTSLPKIEGVTKGVKLCEHGSMVGLCKFGC